MSYYDKYLKYKNKYLQLKQYGSGISEEQQSTFNILYNEIFTGIELNDEQFITYEKLVESGSNINILDNLIKLLNILFMKLIKADKFTLFINNKDPNIYYGNIEKLVKHCDAIYMYINKILIDTGFDKTLILLPGDSPTYFLYIIQIMYPDFYEKINKIFIPISKLRNDQKTTDFIKPIIDKKLKEIPSIANIIIIDYAESGCSSFKYLYDIIQYTNKNIRFLDLTYFFFHKDIDFNEKGDSIEFIAPVKRDIIFCEGKEFNKPYTDLFMYPYKFNKSIDKYPKSFPIELQNNINILRFFVDDKDGLFGEYFRCQFSNKLNNGGLVIDKNNVKLCDLFRLFMYFYINKKDLLYDKTRLYLESI